MSKRKTDVIENFGERLAQLRKAAGYTQVEFAAEVGITQRMVAYYEVPNAQPPAHLLPQMAQVLGVGADVLLGMAQPRKVKRLATNSLERRLLAIEKLDPKAKRQITQLLDTFIEREKLKQRVDELFAAMDRMAAVDEPAVMSPEEVAQEIAAMRTEQRDKRAN